ncbi:MAG: ABC transporter ATP-binding protein [Thermosynechococcaceae cyanobacterium]
MAFDIQQSEIGILLGPSGCGKSTILRMVAGLESISAGQILLSGHPVTGPGRDRGMVFHGSTSFPWLTVKENVEYGLKVNGTPRAERRDIANHFIDRVRLTKFRDAYPDQLSGGMRQRVAIARAIANGPEILLMDEPFGALDPETRWQMQELLLDIVHTENMTVLMVTHDVDEALFLADKIVFLSSHPGTIKEIIPAPRQGEAKPVTKEGMYEISEYIDLQKRIMHLMREVAHDPAR